ncbi:MAG TPA: hypothetical protein VF111_08445 [Thermoanaerobaculia bacterium]
MHRQTLVALSWCLVLGTALAILWEVHRSHDPLPPPETTTSIEGPAETIVYAAASAPRAAPEVSYRGNTNTHKFHRKGCRYYSCPNCTAKFATREEAIKAGYRPCGTCDP